MNKKSDVSQKLLLAGVAICILLGGFFIGSGIAVLYRSLAYGSIEGEKDAISIDEKRKTLQNLEVSRLMENVTINDLIQFDNQSAFGDAEISNHAENQAGIKVTLLSDSNGEELYKSDIIEPNYYIEQIQLDVSLPPGQYDCTALIQYYSLADDSYIGESAMKVLVIIKN